MSRAAMSLAFFLYALTSISQAAEVDFVVKNKLTVELRSTASALVPFVSDEISFRVPTARIERNALSMGTKYPLRNNIKSSVSFLAVNDRDRRWQPAYGVGLKFELVF